MRAIWKGSISFGLVNIPIALYPATRKEELSFRLLRRSDLSPVNYKRVAEKDGKEVPWDEIVKGYEYEKGKYVVLKNEDFQRVDLEATQTVDIQDFVDQEEIDPIFFYKPYYLEPQKGGDKAYVLLRDALAESKKVGIAKVVIKTRQYLAGVKAEDGVLVLELMHFAEELADSDKLHVPKKIEPGKREINMAKALIDSMSSKWDPEKYRDDYREALMEVIEEKVEAGGKEIEAKPKPKRQPTKVIDLVSVLQKSLEQTGAKTRSTTPKIDNSMKKIFLATIAFIFMASLIKAEPLSPAEVKNLLARIRQERAAAPQVQADFQEEKTMRLMNKPIVSSGKVSFQMPNKFRREVKGSSPSVTVSDGQQLWIYYPNFKSAERYSLGKRSPLDSVIAAINTALNLENVEGSFHIAATKIDPPKAGYELDLTPRSPSMKRMFQKLKVQINDDLLLQHTEMLQPNGDRVVTVYSNQTRVPIPASTFEFTPPARTEVSSPLGR